MQGRKILVGFILVLYCSFALALDQYDKLWPGFNIQGEFKDKWKSFIFTQLRLINRSHPIQAGLIEAGIGYQLFPNESFWVGYRWTGHNPYNDFFQEDRIFQQMLAIIKQPHQYFIFRSRLEELYFTNRAPMMLRFRQRIGIERKVNLVKNIFPVVYDEMFFPLNQTGYTSSKFINENRLFLGFNYFLTKTTWWEIGYINQYRYKTPLMTQNEMSHVLSITYNII